MQICFRCLLRSFPISMLFSVQCGLISLKLNFDLEPGLSNGMSKWACPSYKFYLKFGYGKDMFTVSITHLYTFGEHHTLILMCIYRSKFGKKKLASLLEHCFRLCPQSMGIYSLLSALSSSFVWDETQEIACFLTADEACFLSVVNSFIWDHYFCLGSNPMVYCLLLYKTFSQEAGSVVAISLSRSVP